MELEMLVAALLVKKFFRRIIALFTEGENNWIKTEAGLIQSTHCKYLQKLDFCLSVHHQLGEVI